MQYISLNDPKQWQTILHYHHNVRDQCVCVCRCLYLTEHMLKLSTIFNNHYIVQLIIALPHTHRSPDIYPPYTIHLSIITVQLTIAQNTQTGIRQIPPSPLLKHKLITECIDVRRLKKENRFAKCTQIYKH